jgi:uncharacterized repeat protein (TIGR03847 family)
VTGAGGAGDLGGTGMGREIDLGSLDRFSVGTSGPVGSRLFLLHFAQGTVEGTVKVEKEQVAVLATHLGRIVRELGRPGHLPDDLDFDTDVEPEWVVGTIGISYDDESDRLVLVLEEAGEEGTVARLAVTREQAAAFAIRATGLVEAGRPPCPLCGLPLDPSGHDCPRTNGHRPPVT